MGTCHVCRREVPRSEFEAQRAVILLKRAYCRDCAETIAGRTAWKPPSTMRRITRLVLGRRGP